MYASGWVAPLQVVASGIRLLHLMAPLFCSLEVTPELSSQ